MKVNQHYTGLEIAVIGIACRFPGAANWREYWDNLINSIESISFLSDQSLQELGVDEKTIHQANFVNAKATLKNKDLFDHHFFDYSQTEAGLLNPVHRVFHECVWEALEDAGYTPGQVKGQISVFAGAGDDANWKAYTMMKKSTEEIDIDDFTLNLINNKDHLATLLSYKLNLKGPSFSINTACSTSLAAINLACKSLLLGETSMALAGGASVATQKQAGYFYQEGLILSADGHCRAFDKDATGTVASEGAGVVVLKRWKDAMNDGDQVYAIIKGSATNNDGSLKVGYTAPGIDGQIECIVKAQNFAGVEQESITYIETHGTGTRLGDPIEVEALNTVFNENKAHTCAIGSVKTNIGHTGAAAGVAGLIKAALCLKYKQIPASLHFREPNPEINFEAGPFYVNTALKQWKHTGDFPLRAGVSSFGIGGTNVHVILEEAPEREGDAGPEDGLLSLSARSANSLARYIDDLKLFLLKEPAINLADMCYTLQTGRKHFKYRSAIAFKDKAQLIHLLSSGKLKEQVTKVKESHSIVWMFPGQGTQYTGMGRELYEKEPVFKEAMDKGFAIIEDLTGEDFKAHLFAVMSQPGNINETRYTQPIIFLVEYSLTRLMLSLGIVPQYMIGHSIGEYVAACISGVFSFEEAIRLVVKRSALMNTLPPGTMVSVAINEAEAKVYLSKGISLAAVNGPEQVVFSGETTAMEALKERWTQSGIPHITLSTSHAFHSDMQDTIMDPFREELAKVKFNKIRIPFLSNLTGDFIREEEAVSPDYWVRQMRETVRFSKGIVRLLTQDNHLLFIEAGPGHSLAGLLKQHPAAAKPVVVNLIRSAKEQADNLQYFRNSIAQLWANGIDIDWAAYYRQENRKKISLPTYSFEPVHHPTEVDALGTTFFRANDRQASPAKYDLKGPDENSMEERPDLSTPYAAPSTDSEKKLKDVFERFLGIAQIGVEDNFFELGGDSLKGMVLLKKVKEAFDVEMSLSDFFENQTIRKIALDIDKNRNQPEERPGGDIPLALPQSGYPLSASQRRSWITSQFDLSNVAYNMSQAYIFDGQLNYNALEQAFLSLIERHESLRTIFRQDDQGEIKQVIQEPGASGFKMTVHDLRNNREELEQVKLLVQQEISRPFHLVSGPLIRAVLYQVEDNKWIFFYVIHHISCDSWSMDILEKEMLFFYNVHNKGEVNPLKPLRIQYKDYAIWQKGQLSQQELARHEAYWLKKFGGELPVLELRGDRPRPTVRTYNAGTIHKHFDSKLTRDFISFCQDQGGTLFMGLMSVLNALLYRYTEQEDFIIGFPIAGRDHADLEDQIGFYARTLALRTQFKGDNSYSELFNMVKRTALEAYEYQQYHFDDLVNALDIQRDASRSVLFDVFMVLQKTEGKGGRQKPGFDELKVSAYEGEGSLFRDFDLAMNFFETENTLHAKVEYNSDLYDKSTIERLVMHFEQLLAAVQEYSDKPLCQLCFLNETEKKQLLVAFNDVKGITGTSSYEAPKNKPLDFSLFYFGNEGNERDNYRLLIEGAKYADKNGYTAVWTPERHFHAFGAPYPNPAVLGAAIATVTENISIRAGSVVVPLHSPLRIAEEWSVVDNLSGGRVGIACASGWNAADFTVAPANYKKRHEHMYQMIDTVKKLWQGIAVKFEDGNGAWKNTEIFPKPVQQVLPLWITSAGNIDTFITAGKIGAGILTGLLSTTIEELAVKIAAYRKAYKDSGQEEGKDKVVLMLHTYLDEDIDKTYAKARKPFINYLRNSLDLSKVKYENIGTDVALEDFTGGDLEDMLAYSFERYTRSSLIGTVESCKGMLEMAVQAGVDEIACLIDFGIDYDATMNSLRYLTRLKDNYNAAAREEITGSYQKNKTIIDLFEEQVRKNPDKIALVAEETVLSYSALNERANQLGDYLRKRYKVRADDLVGIKAGRNEWMMIAMLGVLKSGAAYVPIEQDYPQERIDYMLTDSRCKVLIDQEELDLFQKEMHKYSGEDLVSVNQSADLAYVIYTSGSTGQPKGVMIEHRNVISLCENNQSRFFLEPDMVFGGITNYSFDMSVLELLGAMLYGMKLILIANPDPINILALLRSNKIDVLQLTPSRLQQLREVDKEGLEALKHLKVLLVGGEPLSPDNYEYLKGLTPVKVVHVYGPTETTVWSSGTELQKGIALSVGKPLINEQIIILDSQHNLVPIGVPGEICISGEGVARGYLHRADLTAEKFVTRTDLAGGRIYRTGDIGRWREDGHVEFIGRRDDQVKVRGYRVELGEIESILRQHPDIDAVVVIAQLNTAVGTELAAYVVSKERLNVTDMHRYLSRRLPAYMVPDYFAQLDTLPLTKNGKINKKALPSPESAGMSTNVEYRAPGNETEKGLVLIWQEVLGKEKIGVKDNFFDLGGHSLKATKIIARIKRELKIETDLRSIFSNPTIEALAGRVSKDKELQIALAEDEDTSFEEILI